MSSKPLPFFCELCKKGYARISELEVHETSYDHHHRKRAADLRHANRDTTRRARNTQETLGVLGDGMDGRQKKKRVKREHNLALGESGKNSADIRRRDSQRAADIAKIYGHPTSSKEQRSPTTTDSSVKSDNHILAPAPPSYSLTRADEAQPRPPAQRPIATMKAPGGEYQESRGSTSSQGYHEAAAEQQAWHNDWRDARLEEAAIPEMVSMPLSLNYYAQQGFNDQTPQQSTYDARQYQDWSNNYHDQNQQRTDALNYELDKLAPHSQPSAPYEQYKW